VKPAARGRAAQPQTTVISRQTVLVNIGEYRQAIDLYTGLLAEYPHQAMVWLSFGHVLKTAGRQDESIRAYRRSLELVPNLAVAWWKPRQSEDVFAFSAADVETMRSQLARDRRLDRRSTAPGIRAWQGLRGRRAIRGLRSGTTTKPTACAARRFTTVPRRPRAWWSARGALYTAGVFFTRGAGRGPARHATPVFIVGMPRAGSTLVEQILSSHSLVEGTMELYDMISLARSLDVRGPARAAGTVPGYPGCADTRTTKGRSGERYLGENAGCSARAAPPYFIDKMPNNFPAHRF